MLSFSWINFANGDMVGHTGIMEAAIQAWEAVDACVKDGVLGDIAPTILKLMGVEQPAAMTQHSLV